MPDITPLCTKCRIDERWVCLLRPECMIDVVIVVSLYCMAGRINERLGCTIHVIIVISLYRMAGRINERLGWRLFTEDKADIVVMITLYQVVYRINERQLCLL